MLSSLPKASIFLAKSPCRQSKWSRFHPPAVKFDPIFWAGLLSDSPGKRPLKLQTGRWFTHPQKSLVGGIPTPLKNISQLG